MHPGCSVSCTGVDRFGWFAHWDGIYRYTTDEETIEKGKRYVIYSGACEGNVYAEKVCTACAIIRRQGVTWVLTTSAPTEAQKERRGAEG